jgi:hypothetical protein
LKTGYGIFYDADGSIYKGNWKNDKKEGHGKKTFPDNYSFYEGNWEND